MFVRQQWSNVDNCLVKKVILMFASYGNSDVEGESEPGYDGQFFYYDFLAAAAAHS